MMLDSTENTDQAQDAENQESAEAQEPTTEEQTQETATVESQDGTETSAETEEPPTAEEEKPKKHQRAGGWQRKIERLERDSAAKDHLIQQLSQQLGLKPQEQEKTKDPAAQAEEYVRSVARQAIEEGREQERQAAQAAEFQKRTQEVRAQYSDFDEVVSGLDIPVAHPVGQALLTAGPSVMYELASNQAELARIMRLPPVQAVLEIGRLEAKASVTAAPRLKAAAPRKPAPAPISPVTARGPTTVLAVKDMTQEQYNAWRDSQSKKR